MFKEYVFALSPAGGNHNYISLVLLGKIKRSILIYHEDGAYSSNNPGIKHGHFWNDSYQKIIDNPSTFAYHNVINEKFYFVIINWWEKFCYNAPDDYHRNFYKEWYDQQIFLWKNFDHPIVRANLNWFYGYKNKDRPELKDCPHITNKFNFDCLYTNYESARDQFLKFGIEYTESQYNDWKNSQKCVFDSFQEIQNKPINQLTKDYQKAIAIGLLGMENNLSEQECWDSFKSKLN